MSENSTLFDQWIRGSFIQLNTDLETLYFSQNNGRMNVDNIGEELKRQMAHEAAPYLKRLLDEGNTDEGAEAGYDLLGNVGFYIASYYRHGIDTVISKSSSIETASALALQIGASLGVAPRFAAAHLTIQNKAVNGVEKSFTWLNDEKIFNQYNTKAMHAFQTAAETLYKIVFVGITNTLAVDLLELVNTSLESILVFNQKLYDELDTERFFYSVRPYYKSHKVGLHLCRGANAGDFAGINIIDMLLGLCKANNASYSQLLVDKMLYIPPADQALLKDCMRRRSFLDQLLQVTSEKKCTESEREVIQVFLKVCETHGKIAKQHHDMLVNKFITQPSKGLSQKQLDILTSSGPPLPVLLKSLEKLRDLRMAVPREDIASRYDDLNKLGNVV